MDYYSSTNLLSFISHCVDQKKVEKALDIRSSGDWLTSQTRNGERYICAINHTYTGKSCKFKVLGTRNFILNYQ